MSLHLTRVVKLGGMPGFNLHAKWLPSMGFISGALVQAIPKPGEIVLKLCDENIKRYSELEAMTKAKGGKLLQADKINSKSRKTPVLSACGKFFHSTGFNHGDNLIAKYEHGHIRVRKLPDKVRIICVATIRDTYTNEPIPKIRLTGEWFSEYGFITNTSITVSSEPGKITFTVWAGEAEQYADLVRYARKNKMKIIQVKEDVQRGKTYPHITITGSSVEKAMFAQDEALVVSYKHGSITIEKIDFAKLGF